MRKLLLAITSICIVTMLPAQVSKTVNVGTAGGTLYYLLNATEKSTITNLTVTGTIDSLDFVVMNAMPALKVLDLSGANCARIPFQAFYINSNSILTSIKLPSSVTSIGQSAFWGCSGLSSITLPSSVTSIGINAFTGSITVDSNNLNYSSIAGILFNKSKTTLIQYPDSLYGNYNIPTTVDSIGINAFIGCFNLTSITIPSSVTSIGDGAFQSCYGLTSVTIPSSVISIESGTFFYCTGLTSVTIPSSVISIGGSAFMYCSGLTSITIPSSVTSIGGFAFDNDIALQSINVYQLKPIVLSDYKYFFSNVDTTTCILHVPFGSKTAYENAAVWRLFKHIVEMKGVLLSDSVLSLPSKSIIDSSIIISSNTTWIASSNQSWLKIAKTDSINGNAQLMVTADANQTMSREATITISSAGFPSNTITVTQAGTTSYSSMISENSFTLYPNPTHTSFSINNEGIAKLAIYDLNENIVLNTTVQAKEVIPVSKLRAGMYIVKIITPTSVVTKRLIVE